jgi:hypothetical protein
VVRKIVGHEESVEIAHPRCSCNLRTAYTVLGVAPAIPGSCNLHKRALPVYRWATRRER